MTAASSAITRHCMSPLASIAASHSSPWRASRGTITTRPGGPFSTAAAPSPGSGASPSSRVVRSRRRSSSIISLARSRLRTRANSARSLIGLVRKSSAPLSSPFSRSWGSDRAVTMMTGMQAVAGSALRRRQTSKPDMSGIITSSRIRSGCSSRARASAAAPESAWITSK